VEDQIHIGQFTPAIIDFKRFLSPAAHQDELADKSPRNNEPVGPCRFQRPIR
jgi:hypothetical protein